MIDIPIHYLCIHSKPNFLLWAAWVVDHNSYRPRCDGR